MMSKMEYSLVHPGSAVLSRLGDSPTFFMSSTLADTLSVRRQRVRSIRDC